MRKILIILAMLALAVPSSALALGGGGGSRGGGGGGGGGRSSGGGGGSKSSGGSKSASGSGGSKSSSAPKQPTASKPSTGSVSQRAPVAKLVPPKPPKSIGTIKTTGGRSVPPRVSVPRGHDYGRDRVFLVHHPAYFDPYGGLYYGSYGNPYYYLWLGSMMDGDHSNDPQPPENDSLVSDALESYLGVIQQEAEFMAGKK